MTHSLPRTEVTSGIIRFPALDKCLDSFFKSCRDDMEYQCSEESFEESCAANDYEFLGNGKMYN